jgi:hypothetical protein
MGTWGVAKAKAQFSAVLDLAETEGPQLVKRRNQEFLVLTKEQFAERARAAPSEKPFVSGWDALRPPEDMRFDYDFPRLKSKARAAKL